MKHKRQRADAILKKATRSVEASNGKRPDRSALENVSFTRMWRTSEVPSVRAV